MGNTKIRIDLANGVVEAEGSEEFVKAVYSDFKDQVRDAPDSAPDNGGTKKIRKKKAKKKSSSEHVEPEPSRKKKRRRSSGSPKMVNDLDLSGKGKKPRLRDFYAQFQPTTNLEKNLIFVYYLNHELGLTGISTDHVFTCYRDIPQLRAPTALTQSLKDTSFHKGWISTESLTDITVTVPGINYLEHDMPKVDKGA